MSPKTTKPSYIKLLNLLSAIRELSPFQDLASDEEQLLGQLAVRWHKTEKLTVGELMQESGQISPNTMYRRLIALRDKGFIDLPSDPNDRRSRFVVPTASAKKYMKKLDDCVAKLQSDG
jgi:DNA-binding MarR family transcriptional regulator